MFQLFKSYVKMFALTSFEYDNERSDMYTCVETHDDSYAIMYIITVSVIV